SAKVDRQDWKGRSLSRLPGNGGYGDATHRQRKERTEERRGLSRSPGDVPDTIIGQVKSFEKAVVNIDAAEPFRSVASLPFRIFDRVQQLSHREELSVCGLVSD